jgi:hypothetical protein
MNRIIEELKQKHQHELNQVGLTPRTNFQGTQEEHDEFHTQRAFEYEQAVKLLSAHFQVRDWMVSEIHCYDSLLDAQNKFDELADENKDHECDIQLMAIVDEFNNVD